MRIPNRRSTYFGAVLLVLCLIIAVNALAITITITRSYRVGPDSVREGTINFDSSYTSVTGEAVTASDFNLQSIRWMDIRSMRDASGNLKIFEFNDASSIIRVYEASASVSEASGSLTNTTGVKFRAVGY